MTERELADEIYRGLTKGRSPRTGRLDFGTLRFRLAEIERAAGGAAAAASQVGVSERTWRRWKAGQGAPAPGNRERLTSALRRARLRPGREARLESRQPTVNFRGRIRFSADIRDRDIDLGPFVDDRFMSDLIAAYLRGDDAATVEIFESRGMGAYIPGAEIQSVESITFGL